MPTRFWLPDKYAAGVELRRQGSERRVRYGADPERSWPGSVLVDNPLHAEILKRRLGQPEAHGESDRASFGAATAETTVCLSCGFERWAWVAGCPRCRPRSYSGAAPTWKWFGGD